ncbi:geranylgeranyldiphosphate synthase [Elsinoe ampelina]|uniref:Geranylgeranyldiphosphate synthase n=1 Tax=Elsinoe ampelina TaxID=302913 RepID=A0A6A6GEL2_9PEZI|nr:geranylgeranyldiphosphate synthase [Elsinoe ampelina]
MDSHQPFQAIVDSPLLYISRLPSKQFRVHLLEALNTWYEIPQNDMSRISDIMQLLHNCSLILDDFQDQSPLRRGRPAAHALFGEAQAINSSSYGFIKAVALAQESLDLESTKAVTTAMLRSFEGQAAELHWTYTKTCPSIQEYLEMVELKTGSLLHLAPQLLRARSRTTIPIDESSMATMMRLLGQYYQIRDDYMNLTSAQYEKDKGFCEDLDEGKYALPLIHALAAKPRSVLLSSALSAGGASGHLSKQQKICILEELEKTQSLEWTKATLCELQEAIGEEIARLEGSFGRPNESLRTLISKVAM